jgi:hypothetical protein
MIENYVSKPNTNVTLQQKYPKIRFERKEIKTLDIT